MSNNQESIETEQSFNRSDWLPVAPPKYPDIPSSDTQANHHSKKYWIGKGIIALCLFYAFTQGESYAASFSYLSESVSAELLVSIVTGLFCLFIALLIIGLVFKRMELFRLMRNLGSEFDREINNAKLLFKKWSENNNKNFSGEEQK